MVSPRILERVSFVGILCFIAANVAANRRLEMWTLTLEQAVTEALDHNLGLLAERYNHPVLPLDGNHLAHAGTQSTSANMSEVELLRAQVGSPWFEARDRARSLSDLSQQLAVGTVDEIERARQEQQQIQARIGALQATVENEVECVYGANVSGPKGPAAMTLFRGLGLVLMLLSVVACEKKQRVEPGSQPETESTASRSAPSGVVKFPPDSPQLLRIRTEIVKLAPVPREEVAAPGKIEMNPNLVSKIMMPVPGRVRRVMVQLGDAVQKGQTVVTIDSPEVGAAMSAYRQALANIAQARAAVAKSEADLARVRDLYAHRAIAQKEVLSAETVLAQTRAQVEQAQAAADDAQHRLSILGLKPGSFQQEVVVPATVSGKVIEISIVPGEYRTDTNAPIMTIADLSVVWVAADVPEAAIRFVHVGDHVSIKIGAYPDESFQGTVKRIADIVDPQTHTIKVRAELSNTGGRLRPEMFAEIRQSQGAQMLPVVPAGAVLQAEGRSIVYVERAKGEFEEALVTIAWQERDRMALSSGVHAGDRVVTDGAMLLKGSR
jgi:cobalt-zinc-cadmium efflux system membrane fusion protein